MSKGGYPDYYHVFFAIWQKCSAFGKSLVSDRGGIAWTKGFCNSGIPLSNRDTSDTGPVFLDFHFVKKVININSALARVLVEISPLSGIKTLVTL